MLPSLEAENSPPQIAPYPQRSQVTLTPLPPHPPAHTAASPGPGASCLPRELTGNPAHAGTLKDTGGLPHPWLLP